MSVTAKRPASRIGVRVVEFKAGQFHAFRRRIQENVPVPDVIRNLARQARLNIIHDPRLAEPPFNSPILRR
jgi:hypothetical protein